MDAPVARKILGGLGGPRGKTGNTLAVTTSSGQTAAIHSPDVSEPPGQQAWIDVVTDAACFIAIGANPTAATDTSYYLPANVIVRLPIVKADKLAAITASGTANLYYHEV